MIQFPNRILLRTLCLDSQRFIKLIYLQLFSVCEVFFFIFTLTNLLFFNLLLLLVLTDYLNFILIIIALILWILRQHLNWTRFRTIKNFNFLVCLITTRSSCLEIRNSLSNWLLAIYIVNHLSILIDAWVLDTISIHSAHI